MTIATCCLGGVLVFLMCGRGGEAFTVVGGVIDVVCQDEESSPAFARYKISCAQVRARGFCTKAGRMGRLAKTYCEKTCGECSSTVSKGASGGFFLNSNRIILWCGPPGATGSRSAPMCCCDSPWRGPNCNDVDECVSSPCRNGGTCEDSSRTELVNDYRRK